MAANVKISTNVRNQMLAGKSLRDIFRGCKMQVRTGAAALPDAAVAGTLLYTITRSSLDSKVAQVMTVTPTAGTANTAHWKVTVNGSTAVFIDDGTPSAAEICTGLTNILNVMAGGGITTPTDHIDIANCHDAYTVTNNTTSIDITSATAGVPIDVSSTVTPGSGSVGTGTLVTTTKTADAYGISLEVTPDSGVIEKDSGETWSGVGLTDGVVGHFILMTLDDPGTADNSGTYPRIVGAVNTSNAACIVKNVNVYEDATQTVTSFSMTMPAS